MRTSESLRLVSGESRLAGSGITKDNNPMHLKDRLGKDYRRERVLSEPFEVERCTLSVGCSSPPCSGLLDFLDPAKEHLSLESTDMIDQEDSVEVVDLVA